MKNLKLFLALLTINCSLFTIHCSAQVLCIYCYDQNDSISHGVNNLIQNGGFENTPCIHTLNHEHSFCPNSSLYDCDIPNWTCTGGGTLTYAHIIDTVDVLGSLSMVVEGAKAVYLGNLYAYSCSNQWDDTACLHHNNCTVVGVPNGYPNSRYSGYGGDTGVSLQQTVTGLTIGNTYVLEFWAGGEYPYGYTISGLFAVDVGFGDTLLRDKSTRNQFGIGTRFIIEFRATSTSHTIKFTNWGHICAFCTELVLDDVLLYTLAELDASVPHCVSSVGINEPIASTPLSLFPNPTTDEVTITTNTEELSVVSLYDITSRKLLQESFTHSISLHIAGLAKGIYLLEIANGKERVIRKIVKE